MRVKGDNSQSIILTARKHHGRISHGSVEFLDCIIIGVGENEKRDNKQNRYVLCNVIQPKAAHT